ncbi:MAG: hypothetical protein KJ970_12725 [Candidatus Eisenbacteria bacterium]|uniref:Uncharacterized protein n=1 Tax=Eiseniibacteriota bacterium TaxID=2212470 RepID=A0A948RZ33_UNCEI|nr:hypothetical protein [Candidatus Eisenbacteria bacterium]
MLTNIIHHIAFVVALFANANMEIRTGTAEFSANRGFPLGLAYLIAKLVIMAPQRTNNSRVIQLSKNKS